MLGTPRRLGSCRVTVGGGGGKKQQRPTRSPMKGAPLWVRGGGRWKEVVQSPAHHAGRALSGARAAGGTRSSVWAASPIVQTPPAGDWLHSLVGGGLSVWAARLVKARRGTMPATATVFCMKVPWVQYRTAAGVGRIYPAWRLSLSEPITVKPDCRWSALALCTKGEQQLGREDTPWICQPPPIQLQYINGSRYCTVPFCLYHLRWLPSCPPLPRPAQPARLGTPLGEARAWPCGGACPGDAHRA